MVTVDESETLVEIETVPETVSGIAPDAMGTFNYYISQANNADFPTTVVFPTLGYAGGGLIIALMMYLVGMAVSGLFEFIKEV